MEVPTFVAQAVPTPCLQFLNPENKVVRATEWHFSWDPWLGNRSKGLKMILIKIKQRWFNLFCLLLSLCLWSSCSQVFIVIYFVSIIIIVIIITTIIVIIIKTCSPGKYVIWRSTIATGMRVILGKVVGAH